MSPLIFDESAEAYHANPAYGSTDIRNLIRSPTLFQDARRGISDRETDAMLFGTTTHMAVLEPRRYAEKVAIQPATYPGAKGESAWHNGANHCKAWHAEQAAAGKVVVTQAQQVLLHYIHQRMPLEVRKILTTARTEVTVRTKIGEHDVQCRIDAMAPDRDYDLKSIAAIEKIDRAIVDRGLHVQQQWYRRVLAAATGEKPRPFRFLFVETGAPWRWRIVELDLDYIMAADALIDDALSEISARNRSGCWDDRDHLHYMASPPAWMSDGNLADADEETELVLP